MSDVEKMARRVFPGEVTLANGDVLTNVLVFVTTERVTVWRQSGNGPAPSAHKVFEAALVNAGSVPRDKATLKTGRLECVVEDGQTYGPATVWVNRGRGCGCSLNALKAMPDPVGW